MSGRHFAAAMALAVWTAAADGGSVASLLEKVRSGLQARQSDGDLAAAVDAMQLTERLDDAAIEQLQTEGAGPQVVEALERRRDLSYRMTIPTGLPKLFEAPPAPSAAEWAAVLEKARTFATHYTANLPNFLCALEVRRYSNAKKTPGWKTESRLTWEVGYADRKERQTLLAIDGQPTTRKNVRGATSTGEFGGVMAVIFKPESLTKFGWERWANLNGRPAYVFSFHIDREHSEYGMHASGRLIGHNTAVAMRGLVYIDRESEQVRRVVYEAEGVPDGFPIQAMHSVVDYDYSDIGGEKFLLPRRANLRIVTKDGIDRNVTEFVNYRKFASEAKVTFEKQ
jgi:hypothetical protein